MALSGSFNATRSPSLPVRRTSTKAAQGLARWPPAQTQTCPRLARSLSLAGYARAVHSMTAETTSSAPGGSVSVLLVPHRSLSRSGLVIFLVAQSLAAGGFAALAAWQGNVLAPLFALVELGGLGACLWVVWRASGLGQMITLTPSRLEVVTAKGAAPTVHFHPYWVRVHLQPGRRPGWPSRLMLGSHGRELEVGKFLNEAERRILAQRLSDLLRPMQAAGRSSGTSIQGDSE
jgi:uncharacterized membrane protein